MFIPLSSKKFGTLPQVTQFSVGLTLPLIRGRGMGGPAMLLAGEDLTRSDFDHLNFFQSKKQHSVHIDYQLKSELA